MTSLLALHDVTVTAPAGHARLAQVSLAFAAGQLTAIIGENGAGKSTLLDVAAGVLAPASGRVTLHGNPLAPMAPRLRASRIASLGQREPDLDDLIVAERIALGLAPRRGAFAPITPEVRARIDHVAAEVDVAHLLDRRVGLLSAGERRRVAVARALVDTDTDALLLDEPHAAVDVVRMAAVTAALRARASAGKAVVFSVHDVAVALAADRVVGLKDGKVAFDGAPSALAGDALAAVFGVRTLAVVQLG
jgi:iron complex transport system ATP-binding protein